MANTNRPFGLRPKRPLGATDWNGKLRPYYIPSTYATNVFVGDAVIWTGTANTAAVEAVTGKWGVATMPEVNLATVGSGNKITGVVCGFMPVTRDSPVYGAASTERVALVCDHPWMIYEIQDDGGGALGAVTVGLDAVLIAGTGSTYTGQSAYALDGGTSTAPAANSAYQLKIIGGANIEGNDCTSDYAIWDVIINIPSFANGVAGV